MRMRFVASGVAVAVLAGVAVPTALSTSASAAGTSTAAPTITKCSPAIAVMGKKVVIRGTGLANATKVTIDGHVVAVKSNGAKAIKVPVPKNIKTTSIVKVVTANGPATQSCNFKKAPKKGHKK